MPKKVDKVALLKHAKELGFNVPDEMVVFEKWRKWEEEGTVEVWKCINKKCEEPEYESPVRLLEAVCNCGSDMKRIWAATLTEV